MIHLLDTDTFILLLRGTAIADARTARERNVKRSAARILARCKEQANQGHELGLSAISLAELEFGLCHGGQSDTNRAALRQVLAPFQAFPVHCDGVGPK